MKPNQIHLLFFASLFGIFITYSVFFSAVKIINIVLDEYIFIAILFILMIISFFYKIKLKKHHIIDFYKDSSMSLKNIVLFFLFFQIIDYIFEGGFIGMLSMWFSYWVIGYSGFIVLNIINYHKNVQLIKSVQ